MTAFMLTTAVLWILATSLCSILMWALRFRCATACSEEFYGETVGLWTALACKLPRATALALILVPSAALAVWPSMQEGQRAGSLLLMLMWAMTAYALLGKVLWHVLDDEDDDGRDDEDTFDDGPDDPGGLELDFDQFDQVRAGWERAARQLTGVGA